MRNKRARSLCANIKYHQDIFLKEKKKIKAPNIIYSAISVCGTSENSEYEYIKTQAHTNISICKNEHQIEIKEKTKKLYL